jgi:hypothetical protein
MKSVYEIIGGKVAKPFFMAAIVSFLHHLRILRETPDA